MTFENGQDYILMNKIEQLDRLLPEPLLAEADTTSQH